MPKIMEPQRYVKTEHVKKREPGHKYLNAEGEEIWAPGWYWFTYRPHKYGPFLTQDAALQAGIQNQIDVRESK